MAPDEYTRRRIIRTATVTALAGLAGCGQTEEGTPVGEGTPIGEGTPVDGGGLDGGTPTEGDETTTDGGAGTGPARLRFAHAVPDAAPVTVSVDGEQVASDVQFGSLTSYVEFSSGDHELTVTADGTTVFEDTVTLESADHTVVAYGESQGEQAIEVGVFAGAEEPDPGPDEAAVRLVNASPDAPPIDVTAAQAQDLRITGAQYGRATNYTTVSAGSYTLELTAGAGGQAGTATPTAGGANETAGGNETDGLGTATPTDGGLGTATPTDGGTGAGTPTGEQLATADVDLEGGNVYTLIVVGYVQPAGDDPALEVIVAGPAEMGPGTGTPGDGTNETGITNETGTTNETGATDETGGLGTATPTEESL